MLLETSILVLLNLLLYALLVASISVCPPETVVYIYISLFVLLKQLYSIYVRPPEQLYSIYVRPPKQLYSISVRPPGVMSTFSVHPPKKLYRSLFFHLNSCTASLLVPLE